MTTEQTAGAGPLFSVVTVTLDSGAALQRTADSIAAQSFRDFEHLVKDGGSTDGSVAGLRAPYGARVVTAPDRGIYDAMNQAIALCRGRFVQFLNAGDTLAGPEVLAEVARAIEREPECRLFYCDYLNARRGLRSALPKRASPFYLYRRPICHQAWFVARSAFDAVGPFDTRYRLSADHDLLTRAVAVHGMAARRVPILGVVYEGGGASGARENLRGIQRDYAEIRARHFSRRQRLLYGVVVGMTAQRARTRIEAGPLGGVYTALVKAVRRVLP